MRRIEKNLRERIVALEKLREQDTKKLDAFKKHYAARMRWWIQLLGEGKTPSMPWLIENDAKLMAEVGSWYWA